MRGPRYVVTKCETPVLAADEAHAVLEAIDTGTVTGLRDRALIGVMVYSFARVNAVDPPGAVLTASGGSLSIFSRITFPCW